MTNLTFGVGFNPKGVYTAKVGNKTSKPYQTWRNMLERCYSNDYQLRKPSYIGCSTIEAWHNFQVFAEWCYNQPYCVAGYQLDKDILTPNNKIYSPETCCFVPVELNSLLTDSAAMRGEHPQGVYWNKRAARYLAKISIDGKRLHLGYFDCPNEAHHVYKRAKEKNVKRMALKWQGKIDDSVFQALMSWQLQY